MHDVTATPNEGGTPRKPIGLRASRRMPMVFWLLLAVTLGAAVAAGASYALRTLNY